MRGDQLARQWQALRAIEASPNGLTPAELGKCKDSGIRTIERDPEGARRAGVSSYTGEVDKNNRCPLDHTPQFTFPPLFTLIKLCQHE
jgi:hypothetical protein